MRVRFQFVACCLLLTLSSGNAVRALSPQTDASQGVTLAQQGKFRQAWVFLENISNLGSADAPVLGARAVTAAKLGFKEEAGLSAEALINNSQVDFRFLLEVGEHLGRERLFYPAERCFKKALEIDPGSFQGWMDLATTFHAQRRFQEAIGPARKATQIQPSEFGAHYLLGATLISSGDTLEGIRALRNAQKRRPDHVELLTLLGIEYLKEAYFEEAIKVLRAAVERNPDSERLRLLLLSAYHNNRDYQAAFDVGQEALKVFSDSGRLYMELGVQAEALGNLEDARRFYEESLELTPTFAESYYHLGDLLYQKKAQYEEAVRQFEKAIALAPDYSDAHLRLGTSLIYLRKYTEAVAALERGAAGSTTDPRFHLQLAQAYGRLGQKDKALSAKQTFERLRRTDTEKFVREGKPFPQ